MGDHISSHDNVELFSSQTSKHTKSHILEQNKEKVCLVKGEWGTPIITTIITTVILVATGGL